MEAPVEDICILRMALRAHGEDIHGGFLPVVRKVRDDGEPRPAVGAVDEGIILPVGLPFHVFQAIPAYGYIRTDIGDPAGHIPAFLYAEVVIAGKDGGGVVQVPDLGSFRSFLSDGCNKPADGTRCSFRKDGNPVVPVFNPPVDVKLPGKPVDERTKSHSLNKSSDTDRDGCIPVLILQNILPFSEQKYYIFDQPVMASI
jgi:hypothetical protein